MTREEFLQELRIALQGRIPQAQVNEQLKYYENYIMEESRKGRTEEEVIADIGSPRLAAKTLIDLYGNGVYQTTDHGEAKEGKRTGRNKRRLYPDRFSFHTWYGRLIAGAVWILLLILLVKIGIILLPVIASVVLVGGIAAVIYLIFFGNKK